ncbi:ABC transporter ATP-binding protein [Actinoplanes sp. NPDC048796]|uniref:ABC transporter ATP-binding protein n=1 Tax=Actinoplanes sp. NPDC048796 TaxID=3155640 RepID=UPI0033D2C7D0
MTGASRWRRIAARFRPHRRAVLLAVTLMAVSVGLSAGSQLLLRRLIDEALPRHDVTAVGWLCGGMLAAGVIGTLASVGQTALTHRTGLRVVRDLRADLYDRVQRRPLGFFTENSTAEVQARLVSDMGGISEILTSTGQSVVFAALGLIAAFAVMLALNWPLALISIGLALLLNLANNVLARRGRVLARQRQDGVGEMMRVVGEDLSLSGIVLGRTLGRQEWQRDRFGTVSERIGDLSYRQRMVGTNAWALSAVTFACLPPAVYWLSGTVFPGLTLGTVVVIATLQLRLSGPIQQLLQLSTTVQSAGAMVDRVFDYLDAPATVEPAGPVTPGPVPALRVRGVGYTYRNRRALHDVDLEIPAGSFVLIAGATGSGKSTLALALAGLLPPGEGVIEVAGSGPADERRLRELVTLVPQESVLFNASLRENLMLARPGATAAELAAATSAAALDELVARLPDGLDTTVGERGYQLSGGERQRLAVARGLLAPRGVIVLDEATSALDPATADRVVRGVVDHAGGRTVVMIAHRIPALHAGDRVVLLDGGRVRESGTHEELMALGGAYAAMGVRRDSVAPATAAGR